MFLRDRFSFFKLQQVFIFEKIERRNVLVRSFGLDRVLACSVVREKAGESLFCSIFVFLCLVVSIFLHLNVSFCWILCCDSIRTAPRFFIHVRSWSLGLYCALSAFRAYYDDSALKGQP